MGEDVMNILIFDDDNQAVQHLIYILNTFLKDKHIEYHIHVCNHKDELFRIINDYDFLFLDIELNNENGIEIGFELRKKYKKLHIIITSSFTKYLVDGYKIQADRYFLKPIHFHEFCIEFETILNQYKKEHAYIINNKVCNYKLYIEEIMYVEFLDRKTYIHIKNKETLITSYPLNYWMEQFNEYDFCQIYKSILINMNEVQTYDDKKIILNNHEILPLSRHYKKQFQQSYLSFLQGGL